MKEEIKLYQKKWVLWLSLIILPPVGIILLWTVHKTMGKGAKIILTAVFAFWFLVVVAGMSSDSDTSTDKGNTSIESTVQRESQPPQKPNPEPSPELSKEEKLRNAVEDVIGKDNLETFNYVPENKFCLIKFSGSENLTSKLTVKGMYMDMFNILKAIQADIDTDVDFNIVYPLVDKYGNSSDEIVIKASFLNETIKKINFENALFENIPAMADEWWNHNAVNIE